VSALGAPSSSAIGREQVAGERAAAERCEDLMAGATGPGLLELHRQAADLHRQAVHRTRRPLGFRRCTPTVCVEVAARALRAHGAIISPRSEVPSPAPRASTTPAHDERPRRVPGSRRFCNRLKGRRGRGEPSRATRSWMPRWSAPANGAPVQLEPDPTARRSRQLRRSSYNSRLSCLPVGRVGCTPAPAAPPARRQHRSCP